MKAKQHKQHELPADLKERMAQEAAEYNAAHPDEAKAEQVKPAKPGRKPKAPKAHAEPAEVVEPDENEGDETEGDEAPPVTQSSPAPQGDLDQ